MCRSVPLAVLVVLRRPAQQGLSPVFPVSPAPSATSSPSGINPAAGDYALLRQGTWRQFFASVQWPSIAANTEEKSPSGRPNLPTPVASSLLHSQPTLERSLHRKLPWAEWQDSG